MVTMQPCGLSSPGAREGATDIEAKQALPPRRTWLHRAWNGFLSGVVGGGLPEVDPRIINGSPATITEAPFMAYLTTGRYKTGKQHKLPCSSSIIGDRWIITAAHCITRVLGTKKVPPENVKAWVGNADRNAGTEFLVDSYRVHPEWNKNKPYSSADIAILRLATNLTFGPTVQPICYPTSDEIGRGAETCDPILYGWGRLRFINTQGSQYLQKLDANVTDKPTEKCNKYSDQRIICVGGRVPSTGPCHGDSGGPLVLRYGGVAYLSGIASAHGSALPKLKCKTIPYVYTRTSSFADWVKSTIDSWN
ncbi:unnamed protein product [Darwinula stevensoni]|uniref:Peptidase S1 domain-containing protein n=1 Tax=Darwinula stevensoni TaxID=69355 RepID=A0A7R8XGP0_9CRUS|nr:unnamed protein product [Darwinula stevensoni]CAG0892709.1 unnamed protein product [Darwinula stevensoni]